VTVPLINFYSLKRYVLHLLRPSKLSDQHSNLIEITMDIYTKCAICNQRPLLPHHKNCRHVFCYYCLRGNMIADPQFRCPICDHSGTGDIYPMIVKLED
jgi:peroxin-2